MALTDDLIAEFAKVTHDAGGKKEEETVLYGTVVDFNGTTCVKLDGSNEITPAVTTSSVKAGDRVSVTLKKHSAIITGNLTDPAIGKEQAAGQVTVTIEKTANQLRTEVADTANGLRSEIKQSATNITKLVEDTKSGLNSKIDQTAGAITSSVDDKINGVNSKITQQAGQINTLVSNQNGFSQFQQTVEGFSFMGKGGSVKIQGGDINLTGAIRFSDLNTTLQTDINNIESTANNASSDASSALRKASTALSTAQSAENVVDGWTYSGSTYIDGTQIKTGTVMASKLIGGEVILVDDREREAAIFTLTGASSFPGAKILIFSGAIELESIGDIFLNSQNGSTLTLSDVVSCGGDTIPRRSTYALGTSRNPWADVYSSNPNINTSDRKKKKDVNYDISKYDKVFDSLAPCSFKFIDGTSGRTHLGMISQDVEEVLKNCGVSDLDFAGFIKSPKLDENKNPIPGEYDYALRYGEFIPLLIRKVQQLQSRVDSLEKRLDKLEGRG